MEITGLALRWRVSSRKVILGLDASGRVFLLSTAVMKFQTGDIWTNDNLCLLSDREYRPRENVTFLENGTKVYALNPKSFVFVREKSVGDPEVDIVRTINIPYVVSRACAAGQPHCGSEPPVSGSDAHLSHNRHVAVSAVLLYPTQRAPVCDVKMRGCRVWVGKLKGGDFDVPSVLQLVSTLSTALECGPRDAGPELAGFYQQKKPASSECSLILCVNLYHRCSSHSRTFK